MTVIERLRRLFQRGGEGRPRRLIVNADDLGLSGGVNEGIFAAHDRGVVTSASLMVLRPAAAAAADGARARPAMSVGLHVDFGDWRFRDGEWVPPAVIVPRNEADRVAEEVERQLSLFRALMGREPSHLDSHQHVHRDPWLRDVLVPTAAAIGIAVRHFTPQVHYCGDFYGGDRTGAAVAGAISVENFHAILRGLPPGTTELGCHPAARDDSGSDYGPSRIDELRVLCAPELRDLLAREEIALCAFTELAHPGGNSAASVTYTQPHLTLPKEN